MNLLLAWKFTHFVKLSALLDRLGCLDREKNFIFILQLLLDCKLCKLI